MSVVQWSKSLGRQGVLCTIITRMLLDHIRIIVHMDISFIISLYTPVILLCIVFVILCVVYCFEWVCMLFCVFCVL